jgi:NAD(P)-dependent dehydrogenase (short-subunit alcohol dehydrogenase family)
MNDSNRNERPAGQRPSGLKGRVVVVTGGNSGIGFETVHALANAGAAVTIAVRNEERGRAAAEQIRATKPTGEVSVGVLDLASLESVASFADLLKGQIDRIDLLVNNAGIMTPQTRRETRDGFEVQFGTNHLGHYALTGRLLPLLRASANPRVVTVSSLMHWFGKIDFDDLQGERYSPDRAYSQSKLANLLFARQLQIESNRHEWGVTSVAAHPGIARTQLVANGPGTRSMAGRINALIFEPLLSHSAGGGASPILLAANDPDACLGSYYGPTRLLGMKGPPGRAGVSKRALDGDVARRLWDASANLTDVRYNHQ